jgi:outer membrane protein TolC
LLACALVLGLAPGTGCAPRDYRLRADAESYRILGDKSRRVPEITPDLCIEPPPESRNFDRFDPDCPPLPPDDKAAHLDMCKVCCKPDCRIWHSRGDASSIADCSWIQFLDLSEDSTLRLNQDRSVELGLLHSREYQFRLEELYLSALRLTLERFEFQLQWYGGNTTDYEHFGGGGPRETNTLTTASNLGFRRALTTGGELLVDFANTFVFEYTGADTSFAFSDIAVRLTQPLLRGAWRNVRMERLTQAERDVLYAIRRFARFRKEFYFDLVSGEQGYLALLLQLQANRNLEATLFSLEQNLQANEALAEAGIVPKITRDQVFQSRQTGRLALIQAENNLDTSLDAFKVRLGLPPELEIELDDSILAPFKLNSPEIGDLERELESLLVSFRRLDAPPPRIQILEGLAQLESLHEALVEQVDEVATELERWKSQAEDSLAEEVALSDQEAEAQQTLTERLAGVREDLQESGREIVAEMDKPREQPIEVAWEAVQRLCRQESARLSDLFVIQTQIRAYLIKLEPLEYEQNEAVALALRDRLDLKNQRAQVVDAWRKIKVAADGLESDLDLFLEGDIATELEGANPVAFTSEASRYRVGVRFDGPLNRKAERNIYRSELVNYQRARRAFIASRDAIVQAIRLDLRNLKADRLNFEIAREQLVVAARQVELARVQLLSPEQTGDSSTTQDALDALNSLLDAKNALVAIWVAYETDRLKLLLDIEALHLDERGLRQSDDLRGPNDDFPRTDRAGSPEAIPRPEPEPIGDEHGTGERAFFQPAPEADTPAGDH